MWLPPGQVKEERADLRAGNILYLREDLPVADWAEREPAFRALTGAGYHIVGLVPYGIGIPPAASYSASVPDLREVYRAAKALGRQTDGVVSAWELYNEPDTGFCLELPDRFTAEDKAAFLGLKAASAKPVLLPSLGLPAGPWLERAAANGLLDYGDAGNLHYYGHARDFADFLAMDRRFLRDHRAGDPLPLWMTEIGIRTPDDAPGETGGRDRQTSFFRETMAVAAAAPDVAAFMPYAFRDGPYSLAGATGAPFPALALYLRESRELKLKASPAWLDRSKNAVPVVLQWAPGEGQADKTSGAYFFSGSTLKGVVRIYNFSGQVATGTVKWSGLARFGARAVGWAPGQRLTIPPMGRIDLPVLFSTSAPGGSRETVRFDWRGAGIDSRLSFGLATEAQADAFAARPLPAFAPATGPGAFQWIDEPVPYEVTSASGPWVGLNGLEVRAAGGESSSPAEARAAHDLAEGTIFQLDRSFDSDAPTMAITRVDGLAGSDFLRLRADRVFGKGFDVRVDLVDARGERFTIFEKSDGSGAEPARELRLDWRDFQLYFWGRYPGREHPLDPAAVREIQLRFRFAKTGDPVRIRMDLGRAAAR